MATDISYNGSIIRSLEGGETATFSCEGTKAKTNVSVVFGSKGSITYKGVTTEIEAGKTANLLCAGKKFATDVVVAVEEGGLPDSGVDPATREITDSWEQIQTAISEGVYSTRYAVGDTKKMTLTDGTAVDMQIVAFDADDKADGSGKAGISWISKDCVAKHVMNSNNSNAGGWGASELRTWLRNTFYSTLPAEVTNNIVEVNKTYYDKTTNTTRTAIDTVWIPSQHEMFGKVGDYGWESSGVNYTGFFNSDATRIKNYDGSASYWWLRTAANNVTHRFYEVKRSGEYDVTGASSNHGIALGFCM